MSLDDLDDAPVSDKPTPTADATEFLAYLAGLIDDPEVYGFAVVTMEGIRDTVTARGKVTDGQRQAVRNIVSGAYEGQRSRERGRTSRRYEGWGR